jgi:hypothetical protein
MTEINNEFGVAGLMGNLLSESGLIPYRLQGDFTDGYTTSLTYTKKVDSGTISEYNFVHNGPNGGGYGLAQWTYYTRKQALYNMKQKMGVSIGSINLALTYLIYELNHSYPSVLNALKNAGSIREASDVVLHDFERPQDQSESVEEYRASLGNDVYAEYMGTTPEEPEPEPTVRTKSKGNMLMYLRSKRRLTQ